MHSLISDQYVKSAAAARAERVTRQHRRSPYDRSPPLRRATAHAAARLARRLDVDAARRAVA